MSGGGAMGNAEDAEIARLEAENALLRANAHALLQHQALLERLLEEAKAAEAARILERMKAKLAVGKGEGGATA